MRSLRILGVTFRLPTLVAAFAVMGFLAVAVPSGTTFAATKTWTGSSVTIPRVWSDDTNWSPAGAPVDGDTLIFSTGTNMGANDIANLSIAGITFNGTGSYQINDTVSNETLTLTGDVISTIPTDTTNGGATLFMSNIRLGADVTFRNIATVGDGAAGGVLNLNGHKLTWVNDSIYQATTAGISEPITGSGTFEIDAQNSVSLFLPNTSTYSGTTNLISGQTALIANPYDSNTQFGTSTINVGPTASLALYAHGATWTFTNTINIQQAVVGQSGYMGSQLYIWADTAGQQISIPNITLNGNARFDVNNAGAGYSDTVRVNLSGIQAGTFCVQYGNEDNSAASFFQNGPSACAIGNDSTPTAPNTGLQVVLGNPILVGALGIAAAATVVALARRTAKN